MSYSVIDGLVFDSTCMFCSRFGVDGLHVSPIAALSNVVFRATVQQLIPIAINGQLA